MMEKNLLDQRYVYLNRNSALPLYYQLKEHIKDAILKGEYKPNDRLPTEEELCKQFSISRPVVRQAYDELIKERLIERRKGSGTFVKEVTNKNSLFKEFISFSFERNIPDIEENSKIVKIEKIVDAKVNLRFQLPENSELLHIIRVTHELEYPISMIETYIPCQYFLNIKNYILLSMNKTIIEVIENMYGIQLVKAFRKLNSMPISKERADFLHGEMDDLVFEIETKYQDIFGIIAILEYVTYLTSKMELSIEINRR